MRLIEALGWLVLLEVEFPCNQLVRWFEMGILGHVTQRSNCAAGLCGWPEELDALLLICLTQSSSAYQSSSLLPFCFPVLLPLQFPQLDISHHCQLEAQESSETLAYPS